jgi:hypothetical protein
VTTLTVGFVKIIGSASTLAVTFGVVMALMSAVKSAGKLRLY